LWFTPGRGRQPYQAAVERDYRWLGEAMVKHYHGDDADLRLVMAAVGTAFGGMTVKAFIEEVCGWLAPASHPQLRRQYPGCAFLPMIELLRYLEANGFSICIASGGDRDFMRSFAEQLYGTPPERVIGSAFGLDLRPGRMTPPGLQVGDGLLRRRAGKAGAHLEPDRTTPSGGGGNSNGDIPILRFAQRIEHLTMDRFSFPAVLTKENRSHDRPVSPNQTLKIDLAGASHGLVLGFSEEDISP
jgi:hypothetical protein